MNNLVLVRRGVSGVAQFTSPDKIYELVNDSNSDWYASAHMYSKDHAEQYNKTGSVAGIRDVSTNKLWWDFDNKEDLELARKDCLATINTLIYKYNIKDTDLEIYFSGMKGFTFQVTIDRTLTPLEVELICKGVSQGQTTFDRTVYDASQLIRVPGTKHNKSGLYKIPLTLKELETSPIASIMSKAKSLDNLTEDYSWTQATPSAALYVDFKPKPTKVSTTPSYKETLDYTNKPKFLSNCRWALQNGMFKEGNRSHALMCLASTYKNLGFDIEHTYRLLKGVAELQTNKNGGERFPDSELYNTIALQVYSDRWNNGQYTCKKEGWLKDFCESLGHHKCKHEEDKQLFVDIPTLVPAFKNFATTLDKNIIKTGIAGLDERVTLTTSMLVGLLGAPSSGKSQCCFQVLNNASLNGIESAFFSMDMGSPLVVTRLLQKHTGYSQAKIYDMFKGDKEQQLIELLEKNYKNVKFCFKGGLTVESIRQTVQDHKTNTGRPLKLLVIDYLECIQGPYSDANANVALVAKQLKDLANEEQLLILLLLQTQKHSGDPSAPLHSMRNIKGASTIEQDCSVVISLYREGFSTVTPEDDKFISFSVVKNRMGQLSTIDCEWDGLTGKIDYPMSQEAEQALKELRVKKEMNASSSKEWN